MEEIKIRGARVHNLKNFNLNIPKKQLIVITGISGSGKSSLAFDILFEEGKNQYLRSLGILAGLDKDDRFDRIEGIGPAIAVRQNTIRQSNPRSTLGSKTGILNQLALLYASDGIMEQDDFQSGEHLSPAYFLYTTADGMCMKCQGRGYFYDVNLEYLVPDKSTTLLEVYKNLKVTHGFLRLLQKKLGEYFDVPFWKLSEEVRDVVVYGTFENGKQSYCIERILRSAFERGEDVENLYVKTDCPDCHGERTSEEAMDVLIGDKRIGQLGKMTFTSLLEFLEQLKNGSKITFSQFGINIINSIKTKLKHLIQLGLGHLSLYREMSTLSGGEIQRIFLHLHLESGLDSLIYVFDEPMAGLHPSEKQRIMDSVKKLRDIGNTVIVVEHDREMICQADYVIEIGPKAGSQGGEVVYQGGIEEYLKSNTLLSKIISDTSTSVMPERESRKDKLRLDDSLTLEHATVHYLKDLTVTLPLHAMVGIAGVSGSGKSSLIEDTLIKRLLTFKKYGCADGLKGAEKISDFVIISQEPIGKSSSSTPASYIGIWDKIRTLFAQQDSAKQQGMDAGYFSFHSKGACEKCGGSGFEKIFLTSDFSVDKQCPVCQGKRFQQESLLVTYKEKNITDVLNMSVTQAAEFFRENLTIARPLQVLEEMGMGYLKLGQPTSSLSGGESQRVKLTRELGQKRSSNILYVLDEPTTGLSLYDIALLLRLLDKLVAGGNSVFVIEHNVEILKKCDYLIELGPGGGDRGGEIIYQGKPEVHYDR